MTVKNVPEAKKALKQIYTLFLKELKTSLQVNSLLLQTRARTVYLKGGTTNSRLKMRTGKLAASTKALSIEKTSKGFKAGLGFGTKYAAVHVGDIGTSTTIRGKNGGYLKIPLPAVQTKGGVTRGSDSYQVTDTYFTTSGVVDKVFPKFSKKGNLILFGYKKRQKGKRAGSTYGKLVPLFVLKKQVKIKARIPPKALIKFIRPKIIKDLENVMTKFRKAS